MVLDKIITNITMWNVVHIFTYNITSTLYKDGEYNITQYNPALTLLRRELSLDKENRLALTRGK